MKIRDIAVNEQVDMILLVKAASARETRNKKPYLSLELTDGTDTINGNYWDWAGVNIPAKNAILNVSAQVTEWQGTKQLNIKRLSTNNDVPVSHFLPTAGYDAFEVFNEAYALADGLQDLFLRRLATSLLTDLKPLWCTVPGAKGIHHAFVAGTLVHSLSVAKLSKAMAETTVGANVDLCTIGGLLHDIGKLYTYKMDGVVIDRTDEGMLYEHLFIGAELIGRYASDNFDMTGKDAAKLEMLRHIILSHHGKQEYGAVVVPMSLEAHIVHFADNLDATAEQIRVQSEKVPGKWTDKIWALNNVMHISTKYVEEIMQ